MNIFKLIVVVLVFLLCVSYVLIGLILKGIDGQKKSWKDLLIFVLALFMMISISYLCLKALGFVWVSNNILVYIYSVTIEYCVWSKLSLLHTYKKDVMKNVKTFDQMSIIYVFGIITALGLLIIFINSHKTNAANSVQLIHSKTNYHLKKDSVNQVKGQWLFEYPTHLWFK